ncbi:PAS domain-containing protein [Roseateles violae]|uniref:histidine kinase n=1 Tax=Roseateles violae TaxID=3058042 RepID=A0ABT8DM48_9BURK|nr:PAS domain-containing protein [Pelomonas sp. PFR6]MDN3918993.1 PAS domain-containing protein [Pelomonas sp. PFR6]
MSDLEDFWRLAPQPALRVWAGAPLRCEANAAARDWALHQGLDEAGLGGRWQALAADCLAPGEPPNRQLGPDGPWIEGRLLRVTDGALLWWQIDSSLAATLRAAGVTAWRIDASNQMLSIDPDAAPAISVEPGSRSVPLEEVRERIHLEDRQPSFEAMRRALKSNQIVDVVARYLQRDNSWLPLLTRRVAVRDAEGRLQGLAGISLDISQLVREREDLLRLHERMGSVAEALGLGLWNRDEPSGRIEWNAQMFRIHQRDPAEGAPALDEWLNRHVHPLDRLRVGEELAEADRLVTPVHQTEFRVLLPDGGTRWTYSWARRELRDGRAVAFGLHLDVTERHGKEFELQQERERALYSLSAAGVGVWRRIDAQQTFWSEAMYRLRGLDPADPRSPHELGSLCIHPDDRAELERVTEQHQRDGLPYECEFRVVWPDGSLRWLVTRGKAVHDANGQLQYMAGVNVDVTERHHAEALALEGKRLEQLKRTQSEFLARVSHELRTPMNAVLGFAQLMAVDGRDPLSPRQAERVARIEAAGRHLLALIDDVLDLARIDVDEQPLAADPVELDDLARETMDWVAAMAAEAGIGLRLQRPHLHGRVRADRRRMGQIAINLLTNAIKYNRAGGWVEVGTARRGADESEQWALVVRDSGRGLHPEQKKRIFEPFNRLGAELEGIAGTGIGLAIVRQLTERMGGQIELDSEPGVGSEFRIWLPADTEATRPAPLDELDALPTQQRWADGRRGAAGSRLRLLCVEDNPVNQLLVMELLALRPEVELRCAGTGQDGIEQALEFLPDVVLLDMQLPDLHGSAVLDALRHRPVLAHCRFIALSANALPSDIEAARASGFDDYWTKPINVAHFLAGIDALLEKVR